VSFENDFVSKLRIKHCKINDMTVNCADQENKKVIKNFYTEFNFLKAVKFNDREAVILFQTGNGKKKHQNMEILEKTYITII
jgi:accessory colonization factor AcfC